jgi:hypothetical protein
MISSGETKNIKTQIGLARSCTSFGVISRQAAAAQQMIRPQSLQKIHAAFMNGIEWPQNTTITIGWCDDFVGNRKKTATVEKVEWVKNIILQSLQPLVNLKFEFLPLGQSYSQTNAPMIRIAFDQAQGAFSYLGTQNLDVPIAAPTMNLGWLDDGQMGSSQDGGVVKHEFGHMLGLMHEHQRGDADANEQFNWASDEAVMAFFTGPPNFWSAETVKVNVLNKTNQDEFNGSEYDPDSIMHYVLDCMCFEDGIPPEGLTCKQPVCSSQFKQEFPNTPCSPTQQFIENPQFFSKLDKQTISRKYPPMSDDTATNVPVDTATTLPVDTTTTLPVDTATTLPVDTATTLPVDTTTPVPDKSKFQWTSLNIILLVLICLVSLGLFIMFIRWFFKQSE